MNPPQLADLSSRRRHSQHHRRRRQATVSGLARLERVASLGRNPYLVLVRPWHLEVWRSGHLWQPLTAANPAAVDAAAESKDVLTQLCSQFMSALRRRQSVCVATRRCVFVSLCLVAKTASWTSLRSTCSSPSSSSASLTDS